MRRAGFFLLIVLTMALLHRATAAAPLAGRAVLALAFLVGSGLVLGAWTESLGALRLPAVTAFLVTGFAFGPSWLGLVRADEIAALSFTADTSIAAVAIFAGAAVRLGALSAQLGPRRRFLAATAFVPAGFVALLVLVLSHWFAPTAHEPFRDALIVALAVGAAAVASSPTLSVASGPGVGGDPAILTASLGRDLAAAALFLLVFGMARLCAGPGSFDPRGASRTLGLLLASLGAGIALGLTTRGLTRTRMVRAILPPLLAAGAVGLVTRLLHVDPVLTGLAVGVCLHRTPGEGAPDRGVVTLFDMLGGPINAAAFGLMGAGLDLTDAGELWGWVLLLAAVRGIGLHVAARWAARREVPADLASRAWVGLIPQSGLILWLAAGARHVFPEWGVSLQGLIVGGVAVNALLGPPLARFAGAGGAPGVPGGGPL